MGSWGKKTRWAREQFVCTVLHGEMPPSKRPRQPPIPGAAVSDGDVADISTVPFRCSRCDAMVVVPRIPSTGRPDLLVLAEHLETAGRCSAGVVLYDDAVTERTEATEELRRKDEGALSALMESLWKQRESADAADRRGQGTVTTIWLMNPKTPQNMGSVLRAMSVYQDGAAVIYSGSRYDIAAKFSTDPHDGGVSIPKVHVHDMAHAMRFLAGRTVVQGDAGGGASSPQLRSAKYVAVDLISEAVPLHLFAHDVDVSTTPSHCVVGYLFGPEDGTLSAEVLGECDAAVYIPTKGSMNLAATVNVLLYDRQAKHLLQQPEQLVRLSTDATGGRSINNHHSTSLLR
jgi:tRNA(Leu) C34 or U34 (ribose-2'-O)-methylase TrmL